MQNGTLPSARQSEHSAPPSSPPRSQAVSNGASTNDAGLDVSSLLLPLVHGKWIILATCLLVAGSVAGYTLTRPSIYQASSVVRIDLQSESATELTNPAPAQPARTLTGEIGVLRNSIELARRVVDTLQSREGADGAPKTFPILDTEAGQPVPDEPARRVLQRVDFEPHPDRRMIEIVVESRAPEEASTLANVYARAYKQHSQEKARKSVTAAREFLENQADKQRKKIQRLEQQWESFARNNQLVAQGEGGDRLATQYNELTSRRDQLAFELEKEEAQLQLLRQQLHKLQPQLEESLRKEQEASGIQGEIRALEERIAQMRAEAAKYYAANPTLEGDTIRIRNEFPELATINRRIEGLETRKHDLTQQLVEETSGGEVSLEAEETSLNRVAQLRSRVTKKKLTTSQLQAQLQALDTQIADYKPRLNQIPRQQIQRKQIQRKLKQAESFYQTVVDELQKTTVAEESKIGYVEVVRSALVPGAPVRPNVMQNLILGILLGLGFGGGFVFVKEAMNTRLRRPEDVEKKGYPLLGVVPSMDSEVERAFGGEDFVKVAGQRISTRLMPALNPWSSVTENYRLIQTKLEHPDGCRDAPHVFFVTSAHPGEGKTITTVNLALTAALNGQRVLLIDADMRSPTAHTALGTSQAPGLAEILAEAPGPNGSRYNALRGPTTAENGLKNGSYMRRPLVEGLYFIPAGVSENVPTKTHDSKRMRCFIEAAQPHFDLVFIDTPPTQAASDAIVIGAQANASALVVSADKSDSRALDSTVRSLRAVETHISGVIFNQFDEREARRGAEEYLYYGSEDYYGYQSEANGEYELA